MLVVFDFPKLCRCNDKLIYFYTALQVSPSRQPNLCHQFRDQNGTRDFISSSPASRRGNGGNTQRGWTEREARHLSPLVRHLWHSPFTRARWGAMRTNYEGRRLPLFPSSPALGRTKPDGRMDVNGAVRTRERRRERERTDRGGQRTERRLFREIRSTESERESTVDRVGKERASERAEKGWADRTAGRPPSRQGSETSERPSNLASSSGIF